ncbi:DUF1583 domain-containing protein [Rubinisphaera margarita]|uniref:DUF1583 domain-containing protein n=1 Tax=Rubinisphaera margarita TaxID=2909586 RepID=UPI001EE7B2F5|nr:DUF1583 domain-containing protein [Rubinisphaera margarita]MCG6155909.1 DUF1583 domain-containing protein [Rubinisphaera margarita]
MRSARDGLFLQNSFKRTLTCLGLSLAFALTAAEATRAAEPSAVWAHVYADQWEDAWSGFGSLVDADPLLHVQIADGRSALTGAFYRELQQLDAVEQVEVLRKWTLSNAEEGGVRHWAIFVPHVRPPREFARTLGERPRDSSFPLAAAGGIPGLFSSGWELARQARDEGLLRSLTFDLAELEKKKIANARALRLVCDIASGRFDAAAVLSELREETDLRLATHQKPVEEPLALDPMLFTFVAAAMEQESLRAFAVDLSRRMAEATHGRDGRMLRQWTRLAYATSLEAQQGNESSAANTGLPPHWISVTGLDHVSSASGLPAADWRGAERHLLHLHGGTNDVLMLKYPVAGNFELSCETLFGGSEATDGGLFYGGLHYFGEGGAFEAIVYGSNDQFRLKRSCPFRVSSSNATFSRVGIRSNGGLTQYVFNGHPVWADNAAGQSPWLGLWSLGPRRPVFKNLKFDGELTIPREVTLFDSESAQLRGWEAYFYHEHLPPAQISLAPELPPQQPEQEAAPADWSIENGELTARVDEGTPVRQSLLHHMRPLLEGERVRYQFFHDKEDVDKEDVDKEDVSVHPALGRLALLIEPTGVRIHWITDGAFDWTGLTPDNATMEPLNRRGPRPLPLKENDWNDVSLAVVKEKLELELNGTLIYTRPIDFTGMKHFGLYRTSHSSAPRIKDIVLSGDWPEQIPAECFTLSPQEPTAVSDLRQQTSTDLVSENGPAVRRRVMDLDESERFDALTSWVIPETPGDVIRLGTWLSPTDPSPLALEVSPEYFDDPAGGEFQSVAADLLDLATEQNRLEDLEKLLQQLKNQTTGVAARDLLALESLVVWKQGDASRAAALIDEFYQTTMKAEPQTPQEMASELLLIHYWLNDPKLAPTPENAEQRPQNHLRDLLMLVYEQRTNRRQPAGHDEVLAQIYNWRHDYQRMTHPAVTETVASTALEHWVPVVRARSGTRGAGTPHAKWQIDPEDPNTLQHVGGHQEDYLFHAIPLQRNFTVTGELRAYGTTDLFASTQTIAPSGDIHKLITGSFRGGSTTTILDPPFSKFNSPWNRFRMTVEDGRSTISFNERVVDVRQLEQPHDPWIGFRSWWRNAGEFRNVLITTSGSVPSSVPMITDSALSGWLHYYEEDIAWRHEDWSYVLNPEDGLQELHARRKNHLVGMQDESLLRYHRPLERGFSVEYEFWYEAGAFHVHPVLDRMCLLTAPEGTHLHWLTDARYDPTAVRPDNRRTISETPVPLQSGTWNHARLTLTDDAAVLTINGSEVATAPLPEAKFFPFGLFHFGDETAVRVRNVEMHGDWPQEVPEPKDQRMADAEVQELDEQFEQFEDVFVYEFIQQGLGEDYVKLFTPTQPTNLRMNADGLILTQTSDGSWQSPCLRFSFGLEGDFDLIADFSGLEMSGDKQTFIYASLQADDPIQHLVRVVRILNDQGHHQVRASVSTWPEESPKRLFRENHWPSEGTSGRLRIARRGKNVYFLIAAKDSEDFQLLEVREATDAPIKAQGIELRSIASGVSSCEVCWERLELRGEALKSLPFDTAPQRIMMAMNPETGETRTITSTPEGFTHMGSAEFTADGQSIAFDASGGSVSNSHLFLVNLDGTGLRDLGPGSMPSLSPDRKQLVCSVSGSGIVLIDIESGRRETLDRSGWGAQWSPDGKTISYGSSGNITLRDVSTGKTRELLSGADAQRYSYIYWNHGWSHDNQTIAFKARTSANRLYEVAACDITPGSRLEVLHSDEKETNADFTFSRDSRRVLFSMHIPALRKSRIVWASRDAPGELELLETLPEEFRTLDVDWSPTETLVAFSADLEPRPVDWETPPPPTRRRGRPVQR